MKEQQRYYSNLFWHFTGSPKGIDWTKIKCPRDIINYGSPLDSHDATSILIKILSSRKLLATCIEEICPEIVTDKFCCVTDIPFKDLPTHAAYYGNVAIGVKADAIHKNFLPVMYIPDSQLPKVKSIIQSNEPVEPINHDYHSRLHASITLESKLTHNPSELSGFLRNYVKVTDFSIDSCETFYREREWRSIGDFDFEMADIEAVIAPKKHLGDINKFLSGKDDTQHISIIAWEVVNHS